MKGIVIPELKNLILVIITVIGLTLLLFLYGIPKGTALEKIFENFLKVAPELTELEKAIKCAYYRCIDGCNSWKLEQLTFYSIDGEISCSEFCNIPSEFKEDNKICGNNAKLYPVEVIGNQKIDAGHLNDIAHCIITDDTWTTGVIAHQSKWLYINKNLLSTIDRTDECAGRQPLTKRPVVGNAIERAKVNADTLYVHTSKGSWCPVEWCLGWDNIVTLISSSPFYLILGPDNSYSLSFKLSSFEQENSYPKKVRIFNAANNENIILVFDVFQQGIECRANLAIRKYIKGEKIDEKILEDVEIKSIEFFDFYELNISDIELYSLQEVTMCEGYVDIKLTYLPSCSEWGGYCTSYYECYVCSECVAARDCQNPTPYCCI
jgi:hypothetical protein